MEVVYDIVVIYVFVTIVLKLYNYIRYKRSEFDEVTVHKNGVLTERRLYKDGKLHQKLGRPAVLKYSLDGMCHEEHFFTHGKPKTADGSPIRLVYGNKHLLARVFSDRSRKHIERDLPTVEFVSHDGYVWKGMWSYKGIIQRLNKPAICAKPRYFGSGIEEHYIGGYPSTAEFNRFEPVCGEYCAICQESGDAQCLRTTCLHSFHTTCLNKWLISEPSCPMCRLSFVTSREEVHRIVFDQVGNF